MLAKALLTLILVNFSLCEEVLRKDGSKIVNGELTDIEDANYFVSIEKRGFQTCGGAILSKTFVISAASCFVSNSKKIYGRHI